MRQCKKCGTKFEDDGSSPNPKCPKCGARTTKKMREPGQRHKQEKTKGTSLWKIIQAKKAGLFQKKEAEK
jgi:DNA-directed RNA polymerase subunit RPC12/RpoP